MGGWRRGLERWLGGQSPPVVAAWGVILNPVHDQFDLLLRQRLIILEFTEAFDRAPGRHPAVQHRSLDFDEPRLDVLVGHHRERRAARTMAGGALVVYESGDLAIPRHRCDADVVRRNNDAETATQDEDK